MDWPLPTPEAERQVGDRQSQKARSNLRPRDSILHQTVSRLPIANQVFLGFWTVDICQEGHSLSSGPQRRHMEHVRWCSCGAPRKLSGWDLGGDKMHHTPGIVCLPTPGHLSSSDLGRAHNAGPTESVPLWSTLEPEPEQLRPGKYMQPRAYFGQFPYRATWKLRSVDQESTHTVSGGKPIVDQTLKHSPHMSVIFVCSVPPSPQCN